MASRLSTLAIRATKTNAANQGNRSLSGCASTATDCSDRTKNRRNPVQYVSMSQMLSAALYSPSRKTTAGWSVMVTEKRMRNRLTMHARRRHNSHEPKAANPNPTLRRAKTIWSSR